MTDQLPSIIVTVGPSLDNENILRAVLSKNVSWVRFNMSHGNHTERLERYTTIKKIASELNKDIKFFIDLRGPKMRVKEVKNSTLTLQEGDMVRVTSSGDYCENDIICVDIPDIHKHVAEDMLIFLHDGKIEMQVISKDKDFVTCKILRGGVLESNKGVNIPDAIIPIDVITEKDKQDLKECLRYMDIHGVALSFVRNKKDVDDLRHILKSHTVSPSVISKIETKQALHHLDTIIESSDIIMYARGDLGVEIPAVKIPITQKEVCVIAEKLHTPVIVATQILSSMKESPIPTRAEMTDAIEALIDGATHLMLSDETTTGHYPVEAVTVLHEAIEEFIKNKETYKRLETVYR